MLMEVVLQPADPVEAEIRCAGGPDSVGIGLLSGFRLRGWFERSAPGRRRILEDHLFHSIVFYGVNG
jgi:hypothetical protein